MTTQKTNPALASFGHLAVKAGDPDSTTDDKNLTTETIDTLANVMHMCAVHQIDFDHCLEAAAGHYLAEVLGLEP